jgi:Bacterial aa3 type cytochrome c oxidase subunit IV
MADATLNHDTADADMEAHYDTYRKFVRYGTIFAAHVAVVLALMAYFLV